MRCDDRYRMDVMMEGVMVKGWRLIQKKSCSLAWKLKYSKTFSQSYLPQTTRPHLPFPPTPFPLIFPQDIFPPTPNFYL